MHRVQWVWLVVVAALVVPHVDGDGRVEGGEEVVGTWWWEGEGRREDKAVSQSAAAMVGQPGIFFPRPPQNSSILRLVFTSLPCCSLESGHMTMKSH